MKAQQLFRHSRFRLAVWYAAVMAAILGLSGFMMYRALVQANWNALEREIESIAGTLHDSVEPILPQSQALTTTLQQILPELCVAAQPCNNRPTLIQRHTTGISDRETYYIRLYDAQGKLLAFSPNQPVALPRTLNPIPWQTHHSPNGIRYRQFTIILHSSAAKHTATDGHTHAHSWGYFQVGRTLETFDAELARVQWIAAIGFPITLGLVALSSWWLAGLAMQPIYQSYQQQQQFTANAAHELRSPLASLLATVEALIRLPQSDHQAAQTMLHTVDRQGRRLSHLITDLLLLSSIEQNSYPTSFIPCCLNDLVSDLAEEFSELAVAANIQLSSRYPTESIYTLGHEPHLYRAISNLITNAIKYTQPEGEVQISLALEKRERMANIVIQDTGIGIPATDLDLIFERFYRVNHDRGRQSGGTGLGLAIAKAIIQLHRGNITVSSEVDFGSSFTIHLPTIRQPNKPSV